MKKVIFFGSIPTATKCLKHIINNYGESIDLLGVCCTPMESSWRKNQEEITVYEFAKKNNIPILSHLEVEELSPDLGISIRYNKLLKDSTIGVFKEGIYNSHGGILPEYRGTYCNIHSILNNESKFGVTLHKISKGIDTGDILDTLTIDIQSDDTGFDLYLESERLCFEILQNNIRKLLFEEYDLITQETLIGQGRKANTYYSSKLSSIKEVKLDDLKDRKTIDIIRAFDSPYHEPAYTIINGEKIYLRTKFK